MSFDVQPQDLPPLRLLQQPQLLDGLEQMLQPLLRAQLEESEVCWDLQDAHLRRIMRVLLFPWNTGVFSWEFDGRGRLYM